MELRSIKIPFMATREANAFAKMTNFTEFSVSKNPKEYTRKYIDEDFERSDIVAYGTSVNYKFDFEPENAAHQTLVDITDNERVGDAAKVTIAVVDLSAVRSHEGSTLPGGVFPCVMREFSVAPSSEGDDADVYTYSGTLKAVGGITKGYMQINEDGNGKYYEVL